MIRARKRQDELTRALQSLVNLDLMLLQIGWGHHSHDIQQYVGVFLEENRCLLLDSFLEFLAVSLWHTVPLLWRAPVRIVDREEHEVLVVPAERGVTHANVEPRDVDARNVMSPRELHQRVYGSWQIIQVPGMVHEGCLLGAGLRASIASLREATAESASWHISCILDARSWPHLILYHVPVALL